MSKFRLLLVIAAFLVHPPIAMGRPTLCDGYLAMEVHFSHQSTSLASPELEQVEKFVARVRDADFCPLAAVIAVGHADPSEGVTEVSASLAAQRAKVVAGVMRQMGIPDDVLYVEDKGARQPVWSEANRNARVEIEVRGGCPVKQCPLFPLASDGYRHPDTSSTKPPNPAVQGTLRDKAAQRP